MTQAPAKYADSALAFYGAPSSPFSLRIQLAAQAKGVQLMALPLPSGGLRAPEFIAFNPAAKIPVLITEAGLAISESAVILEYLEDRYPRPSLLPASPDERAFMRMIICMIDRYVMAPVIRLFPHLDPAQRIQSICEGEVARWRAGLGYLDRLLTRPLAPVEASLSMSDCALAPSFHLGTRIAAMIGLDEDPASAFPRLAALFGQLKQNTIIVSALERMTAVQETKDLAARLPSVAHKH